MNALNNDKVRGGKIVLPKNMTLEEKVKYIRDSDQLTDYRIAKETGINISVVQDFRSQKAAMERIRFGNAIKYGALFDELFELNKKK